MANPYYGIGLAVHTHLIICGRCGLGAFKPNGPRPDARPAPALEHDRAEKSAKPWLGWKVRWRRTR